MSESFPYADEQARQSTAPVPLDSEEPEWPSATRYASHLESYYDAVTDAYDDWSSGIHRRLAARLIEIASPIPGERLLDVGCGTGLVTQIVGAVRKQPTVRVGTIAGSQKILNRLGQQRILGALGNRWVAVDGQHRQQFHAVLETERDTPTADGQLLLRARVAGTYLL